MPNIFQRDAGSTLTIGLVSYYKLNNTKDSFASSHLTNVNGATFEGGRSVGSVKFNGTTQELVRASPFSTALDNISMFMWVFVPSSSEKGTFLNNGSATNGYGLGVGSTSFDVVGNVLIGVTNGVLWMPFGISIGTGWHFVGMIRNAGIWSGYVDNVVGPTTFNSTGVAPTTGAYIGSTASGRLWKDKVDEVGFWTKALSAQERTDLYNAGVGQTLVQTEPMLAMFN